MMLLSLTKQTIIKILRFYLNFLQHCHKTSYKKIDEDTYQEPVRCRKGEK